VVALAAEAAPFVTACGEILARAAPRVKITQNVHTGRNAYVVGQGDMNVTRGTGLAEATG
jgi:hypothetical protein